MLYTYLVWADLNSPHESLANLGACAGELAGELPGGGGNLPPGGGGKKPSPLPLPGFSFVLELFS